MPTSVRYPLGGRDYLDLTYQSVTGEGRVFPRLVVTFGARYLPGVGQKEDREVEIRRLVADLHSGSEMIGRGEATAVNNPISLHNDGYVRVDVPLTMAAIKHIDETQRGDRVALRLALQATLRHRRSAVVTPTGALDQPPGPWDDVGHGGMAVDFDVPRSAWTKDVLEKFGRSRYIWMELPIPHLPDGAKWAKVQEHLDVAERRDHEGADPDVLRSCHDALAALSPSDPKSILPPIADQDKRDNLDRALQTFRNYLQHGRHVQATGQQSGGYDVDHRDAQFALALTKIWLTYIARHEQSS